MKKLKIFTNHFFPENFKINDLAKEFSKVFEVDVITQVPNYSKPSFYSEYGIFKNSKANFENVKVRIGGSSTIQFQALEHSNLNPTVTVDGVSTNPAKLKLFPSSLCK